MFSRRSLTAFSLAALSILATSFAPSVAVAAPSRAAADTQVAVMTCTSGGLVDRKLQGSPVGVYGGGWISCDSGVPGVGWVNYLSTEVKLSRNGVAVAYDKGVCGIGALPGGCSAGTPIVSNPAGTQSWCAAVHTTTGWGYSWSRTYCASY